MISSPRVPGRPDWASGPLYTKLCDIFPLHRTPSGVLDIQRLKGELRRSHEAIYKWLRNGKITPDNARNIIAAVAANPPDVAGYVAPEFIDFASFL